MLKVIPVLVFAALLLCASLEAASSATTRKLTVAATQRKPPTRKPGVVATRRSVGNGKRPVEHAVEGPCKAGQTSSWYDGCNWCTCHNGSLSACTLMYCYDNYRVTQGCSRGKKSGDVWFSNCNMFTCSSLPNGTLMTQQTLKGQCWTGQQKTKVSPTKAIKKPFMTSIAAGSSVLTTASRAEGPCINSDSWFDGCNMCRCLKGEPSACTRMACPDNRLTVIGCPIKKKLGDTWYADCNRHSCQRLQNGTLVTQQTVKGQCW